MIETVTTVATVPAIIAIVNLAKTWGLSPKWAALLAVVLGLGLTSAATLLPAGVYTMLAQGVLLGLASAGLYDLAPTPAARRAEIQVLTTPAETVYAPIPHAEYATLSDAQTIARQRFGAV